MPTQDDSFLEKVGKKVDEKVTPGWEQLLSAIPQLLGAYESGRGRAIGAPLQLLGKWGEQNAQNRSTTRQKEADIATHLTSLASRNLLPGGQDFTKMLDSASPEQAETELGDIEKQETAKNTATQGHYFDPSHGLSEYDPTTGKVKEIQKGTGGSSGVKEPAVIDALLGEGIVPSKATPAQIKQAIEASKKGTYADYMRNPEGVLDYLKKSSEAKRDDRVKNAMELYLKEGPDGLKKWQAANGYKNDREWFRANPEEAIEFKRQMSSAANQQERLANKYKNSHPGASDDEAMMAARNEIIGAPKDAKAALLRSYYAENPGDDKGAAKKLSEWEDNRKFTLARDLVRMRNDEGQAFKDMRPSDQVLKGQFVIDKDLKSKKWGTVVHLDHSKDAYNTSKYAIVDKDTAKKIVAVKNAKLSLDNLAEAVNKISVADRGSSAKNFIGRLFEKGNLWYKAKSSDEASAKFFSSVNMLVPELQQLLTGSTRPMNLTEFNALAGNPKPSDGGLISSNDITAIVPKAGDTTEVMAMKFKAINDLVNNYFETVGLGTPKESPEAARLLRESGDGVDPETGKTDDGFESLGK